MKSNTRIRFPKKSKFKQHNKPQPTTQDDFYLEAIDFEEQAERWLLSDIKKTLRFYLKAYEMYEAGLSAPQATEKCTYNILYNETRLLLQIHYDYIANNGYINILQYLNLDDISGVETILKTLPEIILRFEIVLNKYGNVDTWDLQSNLLISYLSLIENYDKWELPSDQIIELANKFTTLSHNLILYQINELEKNEAVINQGSESENDSFIRDTLDEDSNTGKDGSGVATNDNNSNDNGELMEVSDDLTPESLSEVLVTCLKFNQSLLEIMIQSKFETNEEERLLNVVQLNYLEDFVNKQLMSLDGIIKSQAHIGLNMNDIKLVGYAITGIKLLYSNANEQDLESHLSQGAPITTPEISPVDFDLVKIDILDTAVDCVPDDSLAVKWKLCTQLNTILTETRNKLTTLRQSIMTSHNQAEIAKLSHTVFQLCDVIISSSSNELERYQIKSITPASTTEEKESTIKVQTILLKNARTLLINAQTISKKSCGMQETIVDKLKRNYIYNDAKNRITTLPVV
ncbi:hypothetical protein MOUN0_O12640 [Monosporozyma unispora]|nr:hypothetical protein C6P44_000063 [Kazachstania unispora]